VSDPRTASPARRALGWGAVALGLVAVVAMAANGAVWNTRRGASARSLPHGVVVAGLITAGLIGAIVILYALTTTRATETPEQRRRRWTTAISFLIALALISIIRLSFGALHPTGSSHTAGGSGSSRVVPPAGVGAHAAPNTWWPVLFVALGVVALFFTANRRRRLPPPEPVATEDETIALLDASLDDLRREPDPRRAVVAAYARMERRLAVWGFARRPAETPTEYLQRALGATASGDRTVGVEPLRELTELAELARFSAAPIDEAMRARAIATLERLRAELRTASMVALAPFAAPDASDLGSGGRQSDPPAPAGTPV
jgi:Domain of unknown function (DUF4129)